MKNGTDYNIEGSFGLLIAGNPGSGKSNFAMEWPDPWFCDADRNLVNAIKRHPGKRFFYDDPTTDDTSKPLPAELRWTRSLALLDKAGKDPQVKVLVDDSLSALCDYLTDYLTFTGCAGEKPRIVGGMTAMSQSLWGPFAAMMAKRIKDARAYGKPYIMTCHIKVDENELSAVKEQRPNISGQLGATIARLFTDYWCSNAQPNSDAVKYPSGVRYFIETRPTSRMALKTSLIYSKEMPGTFDSDGPEVKALMQRLTNNNSNSVKT